MSISKFFGATLVLLVCVLPASAQNRLTSRTTGIIQQEFSFPGVMELPVGVPFSLEINSFFSPGVVENMWSISDPARHEVVLVAGGVTYLFSGDGSVGMSIFPSSTGGQNYHSLRHSVSWITPAGISVFFINDIMGPATTFPLLSVEDLYESGGLSSSSPPNGFMLVEFEYGTDSDFFQRSSINRNLTTFDLVLVQVPEPGMFDLTLAGLAALGALSFWTRARLRMGIAQQNP